MKLISMTNKDPRFYPLMGPFLARREIVQYLGGHMWDDDAKTWTIAITAGGVRGFIAAIPEKGHVKVQSCWTADDAKLTTALVRAVITAHAPSPLTAVVRADHAGPWLDEGFVVIKDAGRFLHLARRGD